MSETTMSSEIARSASTLVRAVVASQKILADALEPGGSREQAFALLLGLLDHEEVVQAVAETVRHPQPA